MNTNYLLTSDWQASASNLDRCEQVVQDLLALGKKHKVQCLVHLGDVKHTLNPVDQRVTNFLVSATEQILSAGMKFLVLLGNHDRIGLSDSSGSCFPVLKAAGATVAEELCAVGDFVCVPYCRDSKQQKAWFEDAYHVFSGGTLLFHNTVHDAKLNHSYRSEDGLNLSSELHPDHWKYMFGGHIHFHQQLAQNVWYIGSPFPQDWGEVNQAKGYMVVADGKPPKFVPSSLGGYYDTTLPGFVAPSANLLGKSTIRAHVAEGVSVAAAQKQTEKQFPGAKVVLVMDGAAKQTPEADSTEPEAAAEAYLEANLVPAGYSNGAALALLKYYLDKQGAQGSGARQLEFVSTTGKNLLSFAQLQMEYPQGVTLLTGRNEDWNNCSNGAGKSSAMSAPAIALFGRTLKGQAHDHWAKGGKASAAVELNFTLEGKPCRVLRKRNPGSLQFWVDGKDYSGDALGTQRTIEQFTGLSWDLFTSAAYIGQTEIVKILSGTDKDRKELFAQVLSLQRYAKAQTALRERLRGVHSQQESLQLEMQAVKDTVDQIQGFLDEIPEGAFDAQTLEDHKSKHSSVQKAVHQRQTAIDDRRAEQEKLGEQEMELVCRASSWETRIRIALKDLEAYSELKGQCPTCFQDIDGEAHATHIKAKQSTLAALERSATKAKALLDKFRKSRAAKRERLEGLRDKQESDRQHLQELQHQISQLEQEQKEQERRDQLRKRYTIQLEQALYVQKAHRAVDQWYSRYIALVEYCSNAVGRKGIPSMLCSALVPKLNRIAKSYSELLADGEIGVTFVIESDGAINVQISNEHGGSTVADQSAGEGRMASLIAALSMRQVAVPCNLLILDEPGEGLDSINAARFGSATREIAKRFGTVLVTTHNPFILSAIEPDRHLEAVKRKGTSTLEEL